uniref:Uncharacterized protein n=1 Tax=Rhizophora mucronata TaxID=61149 RepID=A0A2P2PGE5_RHIMU
MQVLCMCLHHKALFRKCKLQQKITCYRKFKKVKLKWCNEEICSFPDYTQSFHG